MEISYLRSSSINNWYYCQLQYYITYVLGHSSKPNKKTVQGSITHKVLECLAMLKLEHQNTKQDEVTINDPVIGKFTTSWSKLMIPSQINELEAKAINKTRINKYVYKSKADVGAGQVYFGKEVIKEIVDIAYAWYKNKYSDFDWQKVDYTNVSNWVNMVLEYQDGEFDPRKCNILQPEGDFSIEIDEPWAELENGKRVSIKGTIDLITDVGDGYYEICDYKSGQRLDWATGKEKDLEYLKNDKQLLLYYYAASKKFPHAKGIFLTIFFIRDGGPFTLCFTPNDLPRVTAMLQKTYESIKSCEKPEMLDKTQRDFRCNKLCDYYKTVESNGKNLCRNVYNSIRENGLEETTKEFIKEGHKIDFYQAPGE